MNMDQNRLVTIDVAKGIGILLVVLGHSYLSTSNVKLFDIIYSFHMPLFFFLSGVFFKFDKNFKIFILKKTDQILKPFYVILLSFGVLKILVYNLNFQDGILGIFYGTGSTIPLISLWFLGHLWITFNVAWVIERILRFSFQPKYFQIPILMLMLILGYFLMEYFNQLSIKIFGISDSVKNAGLPLSIDLSLISAAFFMLGMSLSNTVKSLNFRLVPLLYSAVAFFILHFYFDYSMNLNSRKYDSLFWSTSIVLIGIYLTLNLSSLISLHNNIFSRIFSHLGVNSLYILIFHGSIQSISFGILSQVADDLSSSIVAILLSIGFSLLIGSFVNKIYIISIFLLPLKSFSKEKK
jgi:fucose 4-O-acetylase-like acetyltransferase